MDSGHDAALSRRAVSSLADRLWTLALLVLALAASLGWSGAAMAQAACPLTPVTTTPNVGVPGSTLNFSFQTGTGTFCGTTVTGTIIVQSGGAAVAPPTFTTPSSTTVGFTVTLPLTPGVNGVVRAECNSFNCGGAASIADFAYATSTPTLTITAGDGQNSYVGTPYATALQVQALNDAAPAGGLNIIWAVTSGSATITPGGPTDPTGGFATATVTPTAAGPITITATRPDFPGVFVTFNLTAAEVLELFIENGDGQTSPVGTPFTDTVMVTAYENGLASVGLPINWAVTSGSATIVPLGPTNASGEAEATVTPTAVGPIQVTATRSDDPTVFVVFNLTATAAPVTLTRNGANPRSGSPGVPISFSVRVESGGLPLVGVPVTWTSTAPFTPGSFTGNTNAVGNATTVFTASSTGNFTNAVTANYDPDGVPASGDELSVSFDANVVAATTLVVDAGDGQTSQVGTAYPIDLAVLAANGGVPATGVTIDWLVTAGSATIVANGPTDAANGRATATVVPTAAGAITITATRADAPTATVSFNLTATTTAGTYTLTPVSADPASGSPGTAIPFTVRLLQGGVPVNGANITWSSTAPFSPGGAASTTDSAGDASASFTPSAAGSFADAVTAIHDPDGVAGNGDEVSYAFDVGVAVLPTLVINGGDGQSGPVGAALPDVLSVIARNNGIAAPGVGITWAVTSGSANVTPSGATDSAGEAHLSVTPTAPGVITITATRADAPAATVSFTVNASAPAYTLVPVSANPLGGNVGTPLPATVRLLLSGAPVSGATVMWNAGPPFAPASTSSVTDAGGNATASFTPSAAGTFPNVLTAFVDPDGIAGNGDELSLNFDATIALTPGLAATGGNGQNAVAGAAFALPLRVHADDSGANAAGVTILWSVTGGTATLSAPTSVTAANGDATINITAGATAGPVTVLAARQDAPSATATFNLTVDGLGTITILGGDDQVLEAGVPSAPMTIELRNAGGAPIAGAVITWNTSAGSLTSLAGAKATTETTTTDANGRTSNTVVVTTPGPVQVSASSPLAAAPAVFQINGALGNLAGLDPTQRTVAEAVDSACPALAALPSRTALQQDLLARCTELIGASALDPAAAANALDQMMADVALTQANAAFSAAQSQFQNLKTRIAALRSGTGGTSFGGLALNTPTGPVSLGMLANAFGSEDAGPAEIGADFSRWGFFAAGTIGRGEADEGSLDPAYDFDVEGITAGVDYRKNDKWIFGGSLGYTRQDTQLPGDRGGLDTSGWSVSAYSTYYQQDSWYMDGVLTWGSNDYEMMRRIQYTLPLPGGGTSTVDQVAESDSSGDLLSTAFTFGRDFNRGALGIGPYARLLYTRLSFDTIREELLPGSPGSGLGLEIQNRDLSSLASVIGTKLTYTYSTNWGVLMPHASLEWEHEFKDDPQAIEARFLNDPTGSAMLVNGDPLDTDYFRLGLGMSMVLTRGRSGFFYYERLVGRNGISQWNLALGLRMEF